MENDTLRIPHKGEEVELHITEAAFEGKSLGKVGSFVIFVEGAIPGDVVLARIVKLKKQYAEAKLVRIVQPSSFRVQPKCSHFSICGGCRWQHLDYSVQLEFKQRNAIDAFKHIGGFSDFTVLPILPAPAIYRYRNKMEFSFAEQRWMTDADIAKRTCDDTPPYLGLHIPQRFDKILDIKECYLQSDIANRILTFTRNFARAHKLDVYHSRRESGYLRFLVIRHTSKTNQIMVNLVTFDDRPLLMEEYSRELCTAIPEVTTVVNTINTRKAQVAFGDIEKIYFGKGVIEEHLGRFRFSISAGSFFQTNTEQAERLYTVAMEMAGLKSSDIVYDLYSGTGAIAIVLSDAVKMVVGIESIESAVRNAEQNVRLNNIKNCSFVLGDLKELLTKKTEWMRDIPLPDVVVLDPPRNGVHSEAIESLINLASQRIVYVSCNPATQARDAQLLCKKRYQLVKIQPVDMFPHTFHIENVALFVKR